MRKLFLLLLISFSSVPGQTLPDCGFRDGRPCNPLDNEFYAGGTLVGCDRGLKVDTRNFWKTSDDICKSGTRDQLTKDSDWVRWAMGQQMMNIARNEPINWFSHITAHNAYNNNADVYPFPNQWYSITSLLNFGIRSIDLDVHWYGNELRVCHGSDSGTGCSTSDRTYGYAIREIADWIDANPGEIVILNFEDRAKDHPNHKVAALKEYFGSKIWKLSDSTAFTGGKDRYPTVAEMLDHRKQVIVVGDYTVGDYVFGVDQNGYGSRHAKNFKASACTSDDTSIQMSPSNLDYWPTLYEGRTFFEDTSDKNNVLNEGDVRSAVNCGVTSVDLDFIGALDQAPVQYYRASPDLRREASVWSWAENDNGGGGAYALFNGSMGRWVSRKRDDGKWAFACAAPRPSDGPRSWSDQKGDRWYITTATGIWNDGVQACLELSRNLGTPLEFAAPRNGYQNQKLWAVVGRNKSVWLNNTIRPVPNPALLPAVLDFIVGEREPSGDQSQTLTIYGPENSEFVVTLHTANSESWIRADVLRGTLLRGKAQINISTLSSFTTRYARGDYAGYIEVTIKLPMKPGETVREEQTNRAPVSLHVKLPSKAVLTFLNFSPLDTSVNFKAQLVTDLHEVFRPTGQVQLRTRITDPETLQPKVVTLASSIVNSGADGVSLPDNEVRFNVNLLPGKNVLGAVYLGDSGYGPSLSNEVVLRGRSIPKLRLSATPEGGETGKTFQLIARAIDPLDGYTVDGSVTFRYYGGAVVGTAPLVDGVAKLTVGPLPPEHYYFNASSEGALYFTGTTSNTIQYTVENPVNITLDSSPSGRFVLVDGVRIKTPYVARWVPFQIHVLSGEDGVLQEGDYRYTFRGWRTNSRTQTYTVPEGPDRVVASFGTEVLLRLEAGAGGKVEALNNLHNNWFSPGDPVFVRATADPGWGFSRFTGDLSGERNPLTFNISKPASVKAEFVQGVDITVRTNYPGLTFQLGGSHSIPYTFKQLPGTLFAVTLNPVQDAGDTRNRFEKWSTGVTTPSLSYTVPTVAGPIEIVAQFRREHLLKTEVSGEGTIAIQVPTVEGYYLDGATVQAAAVPKAGFVFTRWENAATGSSPLASIQMSGPKLLRAVFERAGVPAGADSVLIASVVGKSGEAKLRSWQIQFQQVAGNPPMATQITGVAFQPVAGSCTVAPKVLNPLPVAVGPFVGGKAVAGLAIDFSGCPANTRFAVTIKYGSDGGGTATINNQFQ
jgi:hypothetical protein